MSQTSTSSQFQIKLETPSNILRKFRITIPAPMVSQRFQSKLVEYQKQAKVKGFRPGHVPLPMVQKVYGEDVRSKVLQTLMDESINHAIREHKIRAVSRPMIEGDEKDSEPCNNPEHNHGHQHHHLPEYKDGQDINFIATLEILPEVDVKNYAGLSLSQDPTEVEEADIENLLKRMQDSHAQLVVIDDSEHKAKKGEFVDIEFAGKAEDDSGTLTERDGMKGSRIVEIGSGELIPGFEDNLIGMKRGEAKTFPVTFPKDYGEKTLAGKKGEFSVKLNEIKTKNLPELNDEFAKNQGFNSVDDLKTKAREQIAKTKMEDSHSKLKNDLLAALIEKNPFDVPNSLIQSRTRDLAQEMAEHFQRQRLDSKMIESLIRSDFENLKKRAENQIRAGLLLDGVAKKEGLKADESAVKMEMEKIAIQNQMQLPQVEEYFTANPQAKENLEFRVLEEKTVEFLISKAKIKPASKKGK